MSESNCRLHVVIIGAGLGGLAATISILRGGHDVTIVEQAPRLSEVGAGIQVPPNATRILRRWNLLEDVERVAVKPRGIAIRSYRDGGILHKLDLSEVEAMYGEPYLHIHRAEYLDVLLREAQRMGAKILLDSVVTKVDFDAPCVHIKNRPTVHADVVIGADGIKSACRESLLGRQDPPVDSGDLAYRIVLRCEDMKQDERLQDFTQDKLFNHWMGPHCHAVGYSVNGGRLYNLVVVAPDTLPNFTDVAAANLEELKELFRGWNEPFQSLLRLVRDTKKWRIQNIRPVDNWVSSSGKFVLLGDACHATLPYLAQGAAQAVEDAAVLGELLAKVTHASQLSGCLKIYQAMREPRANKIVSESSAYQKIAHMPDGPQQEERDRQLRKETPFAGFPNKWADPVLQRFFFDYDVEKETLQAWDTFLVEIALHSEDTLRK